VAAIAAAFSSFDTPPLGIAEGNPYHQTQTCL